MAMSGTRERRAKVAGSLLVLSLTLAGCLKTEELPVEPRITLKSVAQVTDTVLVTIGFTDGDGDIGLSDSDVQPPYDTSSVYYHNLFYDPEELVNGVWTPVDLPYYYRVKVITPSGQNKALDGELKTSFARSFFPLPPLVAGDTVRFRIRLVDRALHTSNELTTEAIVLN